MFKRVRFKPLLKSHFAAFLFIAAAALLLIGMAWLGSPHPQLAAPVAFLLLLSATTYYFSYFYNYRKIFNHSSRSVYLKNLFSLWGVGAFGILSIFIFALFGAVLDRQWPAQFFYGAGIEKILLQLANIMGNFVTLGIPSSLGVTFGEIREKGLGGQIYIFLASSLFKGAMIGAIVATWKEIRDADKRADKVFGYLSHSDGDADNYLSERYVNGLASRYAREPVGSRDVDRRLVAELAATDSKGVRNLMLLIAQRTTDTESFNDAITYLVRVRDYRVARLPRQIHDQVRRSILEERLLELPQRKSRKKSRRLHRSVTAA